VNLNSLGLPAVTVTFVTVAPTGRAIAGPATRPHPARHATASRGALVTGPSSYDPAAARMAALWARFAAW